MENINTSTDNPARIFLQMLDVVRDGKLSLLQQLATSHAGILQNASQKVDHLLNLAINSRHNHCVNWLLSQYNIEYAPRAMYAAIESQQLEIVKLLLPHISSQIHSLENITPPITQATSLGHAAVLDILLQLDWDQQSIASAIENSIVSNNTDPTIPNMLHHRLTDPHLVDQQLIEAALQDNKIWVNLLLPRMTSREHVIKEVRSNHEAGRMERGEPPHTHLYFFQRIKAMETNDLLHQEVQAVAATSSSVRPKKI